MTIVGRRVLQPRRPHGTWLKSLAHRYNDVLLSSGVKMGTMLLSRVLVLLLYDERERDKRDNDGGAVNSGGPTATRVPAPMTNATATMTTART